MKLSIIIPIYNTEKYVEKCILSCLNQDIQLSDYEIICINDGSKDNSLKIVEEIASKHENIHVYSQTNKGLSAARNIGMKHARGDYYMFLDSDDWIEDKCLGKLSQKLKTEKPDCLVICAANVINGIPKRRNSYLNETPISGKELLKKGVEPCAPFAIWNASFLKNNNLEFYEGIFHEDSEFTPRAYYFANKVSFTNDIIYYVYQNPNSITRSINPKKSFDLINVVCKSLNNFAKQVEPTYRYLFYNLEGLYLNNSIFNIMLSEKKFQEELNESIISAKQTWKDMLHSTILKYRVEAFLFYCFPKHPIYIYFFLHRFKFKDKL